MSDPSAYGLGWIPDPPKGNAADRVLMGGAGDLFGDTLPAEKMLRDRVPVKAFNQRSDGSCVAQAFALGVWGAMVAAGVPPRQMEIISRKLLWFFCRKLLGTQDLNAGCHLRDALEWSHVHGVTREKYFPHSIRYDRAPSPWMLSYGYDQRRKSGGIHGVRLTEKKGRDRIEAFKRAIAANRIVMTGTTVQERFKRITGDDPYEPTGSDIDGGGHAFGLIGYKPGLFRLRNSWGDWADDGECWVTEDWAGTFRDPTVILKAPPFSDRV